MCCKISRRLVCGILLFLLVCGVAAVTARADQKQRFEMEVTLVPGMDEKAHSLQVTVTNHGEDFEGYIRLIPGSDYNSSAAAYDTQIAIAKGGTKQFMVKIPKNVVISYRSQLTIAAVNKKGKVIESEQKIGVFNKGVAGMPVGVLSDNFSALKYLDMGGSTIWLVGDDYPIAISEVKPDSLESDLNQVRILVIDHFNVESLGEEKIKTIQIWVEQGGVLIIGTGAYAKETISGFDPDFIGLYDPVIIPPMKEEEDDKDYDPDSDYDNDKYGGIYPDLNGSGTAAEIIFSARPQMSIATFQIQGDYDYPWGCYGLAKSQKKGSILTLYYGLDDAFFTDSANDPTQPLFYDLLSSMYGEATSYSKGFNIDMGGDTYMDWDDLFGRIDNCFNRVHFLALKIVVVIYVVLIGPILYLILMKCKKREWYWVSVPILAIAFIGVVYLAGHGFKIDRTTVYSISVSNASGEGDTHTYLYAYNAKFGEWQLKLADGYRLPGYVGNSYHYSAGDPTNYYYRFTAGSDGLYLGMKQNSSFEGGEFAAWRDNTNQGSIRIEDLWVDELDDTHIAGKLTNQTGKDMEFVTFSIGENLFIIQDVPAGAVVDLEKVVYYATCESDTYYYSFYHNVLYNAIAKKEYDEAAALSALFAGYAEQYDGTVLAVGVVKDSAKAIDGNCNEVAYECLYSHMIAR